MDSGHNHLTTLNNTERLSARELLRIPEDARWLEFLSLLQFLSLGVLFASVYQCFYKANKCNYSHPTGLMQATCPEPGGLCKFEQFKHRLSILRLSKRLKTNANLANRSHKLKYHKDTTIPPHEFPEMLHPNAWRIKATEHGANYIEKRPLLSIITMGSRKNRHRIEPQASQAPSLSGPTKPPQTSEFIRSM